MTEIDKLEQQTREPRPNSNSVPAYGAYGGHQFAPHPGMTLWEYTVIQFSLRLCANLGSGSLSVIARQQARQTLEGLGYECPKETTKQ